MICQPVAREFFPWADPVGDMKAEQNRKAGEFSNHDGDDFVEEPAKRH